MLILLGFIIFTIVLTAVVSMLLNYERIIVWRRLKIVNSGTKLRLLNPLTWLMLYASFIIIIIQEGRRSYNDVKRNSVLW